MLEDILKGLRNLYLDIAKDVWPKGGRLRCDKCGHTQQMTTGDAAYYLRYGWPKHCNMTMRIMGSDEEKGPVGNAE